MQSPTKSLFAYTILYVPDVAASMQFYKDVFGLEERLLVPEGIYGELRTGTVILAFAAHSLASSNLKKGYQPASVEGKPFGIELGFTCDNVEEMLDQALKAGARLEEAPVLEPWGQTVAYIRDPNGFLLEICTVMED